jgi:hypothetical protein
MLLLSHIQVILNTKSKVYQTTYKNKYMVTKYIKLQVAIFHRESLLLSFPPHARPDTPIVRAVQVSCFGLL